MHTSRRDAKNYVFTGRYISDAGHDTLSSEING